ncbi:hypothetical protein LIER_26764 [Lithospermum erythrorhizon]|uniref:Uncharacterized protein n=1 Tax=Lithospermum erythrorhizon TaxID=34254 RepID=A0AAV3RB26_LITER
MFVLIMPDPSDIGCGEPFLELLEGCDASFRSFFPMNLVNAGTFIPAGMIVVRISSVKGAKLASSVLVPSRTCPATFA